MRTEDEVQRFFEDMQMDHEEDKAAYYTACYEGCLPRMFWDVDSSHVRHNTENFNAIILPYCKRWKKARNRGYGLLLSGDNGTGKTMFMSFVLTQMIKRGATVYYTNLAQLDVDLKRGFKDGAFERRLLDMLESDFVAIDEIGKEQAKEDSYLRSRFELLMKTRYDNGDPMLCATNLDMEKITEMYGSTIESMFEGRYELVMLRSGDFRRSATKRMRKDMGFK